MSIKTKFIIPTTFIIIFVSLTILATSVVSFFGYIYFVKLEEAASAVKSSFSFLEDAKQASAGAAEVFASNESVINAIENKNADYTLDDISTQFIDEDAEFFTFTDADGNVIAGSDEEVKPGSSVLHLASIKSALGGQVLATLESDSRIKLSLQAAAPVYNSQGDLIGAVSVGIRLDGSVIDELKRLTNCETSFIVNNETVATTVLEDEGSIALEAEASADVYDAVMSGESYTGMIGSLSERNMTISSYTPLVASDGGIIGIMFVGLDINDVIGVIIIFIGISLLITIIILVVSIRVIALIVSRIVNPIKEMTAAASALAIGDTDIIISVKTKDEMKTLANAFNSIISNTKQQIEAVKHIATGESDASIQPRSDQDEMNMALEKLNATIREQADALQEDLWEQKKMISEIEQQDEMMQNVNEIADLLLQSRPDKFDGTLYKCMGMMADTVDADRMYIFKNFTQDGMLYCTQIYEWSEKAKPLKDSEITVNILYDDIAPETKNTLIKGICLHSLVRDLPDSDRNQYEAQDILTIMLIPVFIHNEFWGFVGFDNCHAERLFTESEQSIVRSGSMLIANALLRNEYVLSIHEASEEAEKANKAKGDFLAGMSHEMRTPLNAIIGLSEIALDDVSLSEDAASNLEKIHNSGTTLLSIVNDILDVSKIQSGKFEILPDKYETASMINDAVIQNVMRIGSRPISFKLFINENMPAHLIGDELRIKQIINNLLSNAIKYTEEGSISLDIETKRDGASVWLTLSVEDSGVGIKPEQLNKLFTDFVQLGSSSKQQAGGTGLGLSITKSLTEMMDGTINVESAYGDGSTFTVKIRQGYVDDEIIGTETAANISSFQYSANKLNRESRNNRIQLPYARVLLVDDNTTNLDVAKGLLKPYGMKIDCVTSGFDAVNAIKDGTVKYNAVFMDHMMPEMSGIQAARIIRNRIKTDYARNIPLIALTANAIAGSEEMFLKEGFQAFVSKPIDVKKLDAVVHRWIRDKNLEDKFATAYSGSGSADIENSLWNGIEVEGIDIVAALNNFSGDDDILGVILRSYASSTAAQLDKLDEYLSLDDKENYTISIHGIKGTSYSVFANEAGKAAEELENLAKKGDFDAVKAEHPAFKEMMEPLLADLTKALELIDSAKNAAKSPAKAKAARGRRFDFTAPGAKVLIADDNETNIKVALGLLKPLEMTVDTAENGRIALDMIKNNKYHLVLMDHLMPVMDGIEAVKELRSASGDYCRNLPVIALSANDSPKIRAEFIAAGMNDYASKPIDTQDIQKKLRRWLPKDLIKEGESGGKQTDATESDGDLPVIEGIDTDEGIRYSGTKELFIDLLGNFYKLIDIKSNKIEKCMADGLIRDVTIEVHALKSTARMIGAKELSKEFAKLEEYGGEENKAALESELPSVLAHYRSYKQVLRPYGEEAEGNKRQAGKEEITALLKRLQSAMDGFDLDGADGALKELDEVLLPEECRSRMEELRALVADVAMQEVITLTEEMINIIALS